MSTQVQSRVLEEHNNLDLSNFVSSTPSASSDYYCVRSISSTKSSHILMLSVGAESMFTYNTYSKDVDNPWLIKSDLVNNPHLHERIRTSWRERVNAHFEIHKTSCPFMVLEWENSQWQQRALEVDDECIRVQIKDVTIWCHPPRFQVLESVIKEHQKMQFNNAEGIFLKDVKEFQNVHNDEKIPEEERGRVAQSFTTYYEFFKNLDWNDENKYTSYRYSTLQLKVNKNWFPDPAATISDKMRFGGTFSGVYKSTDNEVHHKFAPLGTEPVPMPIAKKIWDFLKDKYVGKINVEYEEVFLNE